MSKNAIELQEEIKYHDVLYHQKNKPKITDAEYDELVRKADIQTVGAAPDERFLKVQHIVPMLSLNNAYKREEVEELYPFRGVV